MASPHTRRWVCVATVLLAACGGETSGTPTTPVDNTPSAIVLSPQSALTVASGASTGITATVQAKDGHALSGQTITWTTSDSTVASVAQTGTVTGAKVGAATITATSGSLTASLTATVTPGAASVLAIRTQPGGAASGSALAPQPVIEIRDAQGNLTASTASVTASIASGGGALGGSATVAAVAGVATFANLAVVGAVGARTLSFASGTLTGATSASVSISAATQPVVALDSGAVTLYAFTGVVPGARTLGITNGGVGTLTGLSIDAVAYDAGAAGWLTAALAGSASISLTPSASGLANGSYHATVTVRGSGATPATLGVTLVVAAPPTVTYTQQSARVVLTPLGTNLQPSVAITTGGQTLPAAVGTFTSRSTAVATVDAAGNITPVGVGAAFVVAQVPGGAADSLYVAVVAKAGPVILLDLQQYSATVGQQFVVTMSLDTRGVSVGSFDAAFGFPDRGNPVSLVGFTAAAGTPAPVVNQSIPGSIRVSWASAAGATGVIPLVQVTLKGVAGDPSYLTATLLDIYAPDFTDLSASSTSTIYPIRVP